MADFIIPFLLGNVLLCIPAAILLAVRHFLGNVLTPQMRYRTWFLFLGLLAVLFVPLPPVPLWKLFAWLEAFVPAGGDAGAVQSGQAAAVQMAGQAGWMNEFGVSVRERTPSVLAWLLAGIWLTGMVVAGLLLIQSLVRFGRLRRSALPLQHAGVQRLYRECLAKLHIRRRIPVYSTAFLKSPVIAGLVRPRIYMPISLVTAAKPEELRYILLHELQHYRRRDALGNVLMCAAGIVYWFHPLVWYARREMTNDREAACDASVLRLLEEREYQAYGMTLIDFAEQLSLPPFPFATGIGGSMAQLKRRVLTIAAYQPPSWGKCFCSALVFVLTFALLAGLAPALSVRAEKARDDFSARGKEVSYVELGDLFGEYRGSFVLYDLGADAWTIYNPEAAHTRIAPASTYKLYSALFALEDGIISPEHSDISWDGQPYPYAEWNTDQTLETAMEHSVTWYFQELDRQRGMTDIRTGVRKIGYGNEMISGDTASYWINGSLKISPIEQVELLKGFYENRFGFKRENVEAVKRSLCLAADGQRTLYGKTGTVEQNGKNISGWFVGYLEQDGRTWFFALNLQGEDQAAGPKAAQITLSILERV